MTGDRTPPPVPATREAMKQAAATVKAVFAAKWRKIAYPDREETR